MVLKFLMLLALLSLAFANHKRRLNCTKLSLAASATPSECGKKKTQSIFRLVADLPPASQHLVVTLPCVKKGKSKRLTRKFFRCLKRQLKRSCSCLDPSRKMSCLITEISICAGQGVVVPFMTPDPMTP